MRGEAALGTLLLMAPEGAKICSHGPNGRGFHNGNMPQGA